MCNAPLLCECVGVGVFEECSNCQVIRVHIQVCGAAGRPEQETDTQLRLNPLPGTATTKALR